MPDNIATEHDPSSRSRHPDTSVGTLARTPLHEVHVALGARMVPFAGFEMPVQYSGIIDEHLTVRNGVGVFDVSHMGEVIVSGPHALDFVQRLVTNDAAKLYDGKAMYTLMCMPDGGIVDDLLVYRLGESRYLLVINAACVEKDLAWMREQNTVGAILEDVSRETALIAVQGPRALATLEKVSDWAVSELKNYHFAQPGARGFPGGDFALVSRTGYTGEAGVEIYCENGRAVAVWEAVMHAGEEFGIKPVGLGARDTLRLEAGFSLYGNDITAETNPIEAGLGRFVKPDKGDFVGREALVRVQESGPERMLIGFVASERGIPRGGDAVVDSDGRMIGSVTSGTQSPVLRSGIGLGYVTNEPSHTEPGRSLAVSSRGRSIPVTVRRPPFHKLA